MTVGQQVEVVDWRGDFLGEGVIVSVLKWDLFDVRINGIVTVIHRRRLR